MKLMHSSYGTHALGGGNRGTMGTMGTRGDDRDFAEVNIDARGSKLC
jgi:hypothetical protein